MPLYTYNGTRKALKDSFINTQLWVKELLKLQDNFIAWVVGFAVSGMSLMISYFDKLPESIKTESKYIICFLAISIFFGFLWRILTFYSATKYTVIDNYLLTTLNDYEIQPLEVDEDILKNYSYDDLCRHMIQNFNDPFEGRPISEVKKDYSIERLRTFYKELCEFSKKQFDLAMSHYADNLEVAFKLKASKTIEKWKNANIGINISFWKNLMFILYILSIICFLISIFLLAIGFLISCH
jgi:hypothetical protein